MAFAGIGEIRLRMGDLTGAAADFAKAEELDASALPGRARLELLRGRPADAAALINATLAGRTWDRLDHTRLLPDQVTIALAVSPSCDQRMSIIRCSPSAKWHRCA
jgi:hypothetical protein